MGISRSLLIDRRRGPRTRRSDDLQQGRLRAAQAGKQGPSRISPGRLKPVHDWTQNATTQADVKMFILDDLWQSLPRPPFTDEETEDLAAQVYNYVWQRSVSGVGLAAP